MYKTCFANLLVRTLCDVQPVFPVDGIYLNCQTEGNQASLFQTATSLIARSRAPRVLILGADAQSGYPGHEQWQEQLKESGIAGEQIELVDPGTGSMLNTLVESEALIRFARRNKYHSLLIVAPPFQQLRAFMTAVTVALRQYPDILLYSNPAAAMPWQEDVVHSQGTLKATRSGLINEEFDRIAAYQQKGDLASCEDVLKYLDRRPQLYENGS